MADLISHNYYHAWYSRPFYTVLLEMESHCRLRALWHVITAEPSRSAPDTSSGMTTIGLVIIGGVFLVVLLLIAVVCVCTSYGSCSENIRSMCTPPLQKHILLMRSNILYANGSDSPAKVSTVYTIEREGDEERERERKGERYQSMDSTTGLQRRRITAMIDQADVRRDAKVRRDTFLSQFIGR